MHLKNITIICIFDWIDKILVKNLYALSFSDNNQTKKGPSEEGPFF
jgi:hypothetical protein